jgi:hypothetical protein
VYVSAFIQHCRVAYFGTDADFDIDQTVEMVNKAPFYMLGNSLDWADCCTSEFSFARNCSLF